MGGVESKETQGTESLYKTHLTNITKAFKAYSANDVSALVTMLDNFNLDESVKAAIIKQHTDILTRLGNDPSRFTNAAFQDQSQRFVQEIYDKQRGSTTLSKTTQLMLEKNPVIKSGVNKIQSVMTTLYTRFKFFEFKYIEMNLFMMKFVDEVQKLFDASTKLSLAHIEALKEENKQQFNAFVEGLSKLDTDGDRAYVETIQKLSATTRAKFEEAHNNFATKINNVTEQRAALLDVIKQLIDKDVQLATELRNASNGKLKAASTTTSTPQRL